MSQREKLESGRSTSDKEGDPMSRLFGWLSGLALAVMPTLAWAEGAGGGYRGIASIYFTFITVVLIYGVHDAFRNKRITIAAAIVIPIVMFGFLLPKGG
jgi:hypothetical protein